MMSHDGAPSTPTRVGSFPWMLILVWFPVQALVSAAFTGPYYWTGNALGDLGAVHCGIVATPGFGDPHYVCSPWHTVMNAATVATGLLALVALLLTRRELWPRGPLAAAGIALLVLAALGRVVSGLAPEDVHAFAHFTGAAVDLGAAPVGMLLLGLAVRSERILLAVFTLGLGAFALLGLLVGPFGLGFAGAERLGAYPVLVWMIGLGALVFDRTLRARRHSPAPV